MQAEEPSREEFADACDFVLKSWQVTGAVAPKLLAWGRAHAAEETACRVRDRMVSMSRLARLQLEFGRELSRAFEREGIPYVLLKGSATRLTAFEHPDERCGHDVDLGVRAENLDRVREIAIEQGFVPSQWNRDTKRFEPADPKLLAEVEAQHYELGFLVNRQRPSDLSAEEDAAIRRDLKMWHVTDEGDLACYVRIDVHHGLSLDIGLDDLLASPTTATCDGYAARVPSPEWLLFHLVYKIYWEGVHHYHRKRNGFQYADLSRQLLATDEAGFAGLCELLAEYYLDAGGHYVLRRLESDVGMRLRDDQIEFLRRTATPPSESDPVGWNDLGDMWGRLWGHR